MHVSSSLNKSDNPTIKQFRRVLQIEAEALQQMVKDVGPEHEKAIDLIEKATGRVIVSGVGKSGHVGRKIAATFSSTGVPAQFVHPTEASHGDLGMITSNDVCLVLSNSGETSELADLITYTRRFNIHLIAITGRRGSTLDVQSDVTLLLPDSPEACFIGVAPTTSTTATLAMGDALAISLMYRKGFKREDFQIFHPGGKLGSQLLKVEDLMYYGDDIPVVASETKMGEALLVMTSKGFGMAGVVDEGHLIGVITDGDLRRNLDTLMDHTAGEVATKSPKTVQVETLVSEALRVMTEAKISAVFVIAETGEIAGVLHLHDCLKAGVV